MSKISLLVGIAALVVLYLSGVVQVELNPGRLSAVPGTVSNLVSDAGLITSVKNKVISLKRQGELYFADNPKKRLELAMGYAETDSGRLQASLESNEGPQVLVPDAELLATSIEQMKEYAGELSEEDLVAIQDKSRQIASTAGSTLEQLKEVQRDYAEFEERLADVTDKLEIYLDGAASGGDGEVAGVKDDAPDNKEGLPNIPLRF